MRLRRLSDFMGDRAFYKRALFVMVPVTVQQLITTLFNFVDNVMVASIDELSMAAVTVANKPTILYFSLFFGFTGAAGILLSQYAGAGRQEVCQRIFSIEMFIGLTIALLFAVVSALFPEFLMRLFVQDANTIAIGSDYLRIAAWAFLPAGLSSVCIFSMRALGINFLPMITGIVAVCCNAFFNWALIFGHLGMPAMGVRGAALGTLLARTCEMFFYFIILLRRRTPFSLRFSEAFHVGRDLLRDYIRRAVPLTLNEILWSSGMLLCFWAYARINEGALSALNVADQITSIVWIFFIGIGSSVSVFVGKQLGASDFAGAKHNAKRLMGLSLMISVCCMVLCAAFSQSIGTLFPNLSPEQIIIAQHLSYIIAFFFIPNGLYHLCFNLLRAGGDTRNTMILDSGFMWALPIPAAVLMGIFLPGKLDIRLALLIVQFLMQVRIIWALIIVKRGTWLKNITRQAAQE